MLPNISSALSCTPLPDSCLAPRLSSVLSSYMESSHSNSTSHDHSLYYEIKASFKIVLFDHCAVLISGLIYFWIYVLSPYHSHYLYTSLHVPSDWNCQLQNGTCHPLILLQSRRIKSCAVAVAEFQHPLNRVQGREQKWGNLCSGKNWQNRSSDS